MSLSISMPDTSGLADLDFEWPAAATDWMGALASHYDRIRRRYPQDRLIAVFDIDGTILDLRHMVRWVLLSYDRAHGTEHFHGLEVEAISVSENQVDRLLRDWPLPEEERERVMQYYLENAWKDDSILASHQPYRGVMDVIRWFQIQPSTVVGLNTGRSEPLREITLNSLNALGSEYRVRFRSELLYMSPTTGMTHVPAAKAEGLRYFRRNGYRVFAVVDNEPENIQSMSEADPDGEVLFLHADTIFESKRTKTPRTVRGRFYNITNLVSERNLPQHVEFVWHGIQTKADLLQFLASNVRWGEVDVRRDPIDRLVIRRQAFDETPWSKSESRFLLEDCLREVNRRGRALKLDLKEGGATLLQVEDLLRQTGIANEHLWFNGNVQALREEGFRQLAAAHPGAVIQCPVDFMAPLIQSVPGKAREILEVFAGWGVNRFSVSWQTAKMRRTVDLLESWGFEVNIYDVPNLEAFLQAVLLLPRSLTSHFNFPQWKSFRGML